jgi:hypothetical protein
MMTLRRLVFLLVGSSAALGLLGAIAVVVELSYKPTYDRSDPTYQRFLEAFERLRVPLDRRGATREDLVDLSLLNNGEWKTACLFGGYTMPLEGMRALGANAQLSRLNASFEAGPWPHGGNGPLYGGSTIGVGRWLCSSRYPSLRTT